ncbi:MAG: metallophosphoesterase [Xanthomonadales bacterium]|nr:metallophosphoesterase [Xanthomonadales bacterium]
MRKDDSVRIAQISDCHVSAVPGAMYRGIDPRAELERLWPSVGDFDPDLLLITGDLAEDAGENAYRYLAGIFAERGVPVLTLPGNHDDPRTQAAVFHRTASHTPLVHDADGWRLLLLDSTRPGLIGGRLDRDQLDSVTAALAGHDGPALVALHHQPMPVGSSWIDRYALEDGEAFQAMVREHPNVRVVSWGHVHQSFEVVDEGVRWLGTPSSAINSKPGCERFTPDGKGPAWRWLKLGRDGKVQTGIAGPGTS